MPDVNVKVNVDDSAAQQRADLQQNSVGSAPTTAFSSGYWMGSPPVIMTAMEIRKIARL